MCVGGVVPYENSHVVFEAVPELLGRWLPKPCVVWVVVPCVCRWCGSLKQTGVWLWRPNCWGGGSLKRCVFVFVCLGGSLCV